MTFLWRTQSEALYKTMEALRMDNAEVDPGANGNLLASLYRDGVDEPAVWMTIDPSGTVTALEGKERHD
jgi:hypothetical protein